MVYLDVNIVQVWFINVWSQRLTKLFFKINENKKNVCLKTGYKIRHIKSTGYESCSLKSSISNDDDDVKVPKVRVC